MKRTFLHMSGLIILAGTLFVGCDAKSLQGAIEQATTKKGASAPPGQTAASPAGALNPAAPSPTGTSVVAPPGTSGSAVAPTLPGGFSTELQPATHVPYGKVTVNFKGKTLVYEHTYGSKAPLMITPDNKFGKYKLDLSLHFATSSSGPPFSMIVYLNGPGPHKGQDDAPADPMQASQWIMEQISKGSKIEKMAFYEAPFNALSATDPTAFMKVAESENRLKNWTLEVKTFKPGSDSIAISAAFDATFSGTTKKGDAVTGTIAFQDHLSPEFQKQLLAQTKGL